MALQKIKFQTNVPVKIALKFTEGKLCDSQFGDPQYMFTTTDDRVLFVAEKVAQKIHGLRLKPGERIDVCKAEVDYGNARKGIEWQISRVDPPEEPADPGPGKRAADRFWAGKAVGEQPDGTFSVPAAGVSVPVPAATAAKRQPSNNGNGSKSGNGNGHAAAPTPEDPGLMPWALFLLSQTNALVDVYFHAVDYASKSYGNAIKAEDVRALLTTAFINVSKNGGAHVG